MNATFKANKGGVGLALTNNLLGRKLKPGDSLDLDTVYLAGGGDAYGALERYGDSLAVAGELPRDGGRRRCGAVGMPIAWRSAKN